MSFFDRLQQSAFLTALLLIPSAHLHAQQASTSFDELFDNSETSEESKADQVGEGTESGPPGAIDLGAVEPPVRQTSPARRVIDEIVVTATKREESLRDVPQSISAFTGEDIEGRGGLSVDDFLQESPGVLTNASAVGDKRVTIRGVETTTRALTPTASGTGILVGDVSFNDPYVGGVVPDFSAFDLEAVEVLKGPQGTLFGGTALAGALRYRLAQPEVGQYAAKAFVSVEQVKHGTLDSNAGAMINLPLGDNAAVRLTGLDRNYPGWIDDQLVDTPAVRKNLNRGDGQHYRGLLRWEPGEAWTVNLTAMAEDYFAPFGLHTNSDDPNGPPVLNDFLIPQFLEQYYEMQSAEVSWAGAGLQVTGVVSHMEKFRDVMIDQTPYTSGGSPDPSTPDDGALLVPFDMLSESVSQELRVQSVDNARFDWLLGLYNYDYDIDLALVADSYGNQQVNGPDGSAGENPDTYVLDTELFGVVYERAIFADLRYRPAPLWEIGLGARFYETAVDGVIRHRGALAQAMVAAALEAGAVPEIDPQTGAIVLRERIEERGINPRLAVTWQALDHVSSFLAVTRGFRLGGVQNVPPGDGIPPVYKSDTVWNYELGVRTDWLGESLQFDVTLFLIDWLDPIVSQNSGTLGLDYQDNVGSARVQGVETSLLWLPPLDGVTISFNAGITDARVTTPFVAAGNSQIDKGHRLPGSAAWQGTFSAAYAGDLGPLMWGASTTVSHIGKGYSDLENYKPTNDYTTVGLNLHLSQPAWPGMPEFTLNVQNLTDVSRVINGRAFDNADPESDSVWVNTRPRTIVGRVSFHF